MLRKPSLLALAGALLAGTLVWSGTGLAATAGSPNRFAVVDEDGNLISGNGVSDVAHLGVGRYEVTFATNVRNCAYVATTATTDASTEALRVFTNGGHLSAGGVYVETKDQNNVLTDAPFNLVVACRSFGMRYAVVGYSANLVRSSPGTSLDSLGFGRYNVKFSGPVAPCAFIATVGDPGDGTVSNPSSVYTGTGPGRNTVYIETKNPGAGLQPQVPFHLVVVCQVAARVRTAVVQADGLLNRGSPFTSSFNESTGHYTVVTDRDVSECATVGTRGSVDRKVPYYPTTVEVAPGPATNTVGIHLRELLFFGGEFFNEAFHTAIIC